MSNAPTPTPLQLQEFAKSPLSMMYQEGYKASCDAHRRLIGVMMGVLKPVLESPVESDGLKRLLQPQADMLQRLLDESLRLEQVLQAQHAMMSMGGHANG